MNRRGFIAALCGAPIAAPAALAAAALPAAGAAETATLTAGNLLTSSAYGTLIRPCAAAEIVGQGALARLYNISAKVTQAGAFTGVASQVAWATISNRPDSHHAGEPAE